MLTHRTRTRTALSAIVISMRKKNPPEWWDGLSKDKALKSYIKADFSKFCEEDDPAYHGELSTAGYDEMGGMGGGMGGIDRKSVV